MQLKGFQTFISSNSVDPRTAKGFQSKHKHAKNANVQKTRTEIHETKTLRSISVILQYVSVLHDWNQHHTQTSKIVSKIFARIVVTSLHHRTQYMDGSPV